MNHDTTYRPDWATKLGGGTDVKKVAKKKKKSAMNMSAMKGMKGGKGK